MNGSIAFATRVVCCIVLAVTTILSQPAKCASQEFADTYSPRTLDCSSHEFVSIFTRITCQNLAHDLGEAAQVSPFSPESYKWLTGKYGEPALPTDVEDGYRYCWKCCHECNGNRTEEYSCLWTDHRWNVREWTYPKCAPAPAPAGGNTALPSKPRTPASDEVKKIQAKAEQGDADSQYQLGLLYRDGLGVSKDLQKAGEWFSRAAMLGHKAAKQELNK
jgi:hypothetical protein